MGNAGLSRQPPVDAPGTAVMYIRGFSYTAKAPCSCATPELLATTSGGCVSKLDTGSVPQELVGCAIAPEEFADGCGFQRATSWNPGPSNSRHRRSIRRKYRFSGRANSGCWERMGSGLAMGSSLDRRICTRDLRALG